MNTSESCSNTKSKSYCLSWVALSQGHSFAVLKLTLICQMPQVPLSTRLHLYTKSLLLSPEFPFWSWSLESQTGRMWGYWRDHLSCKLCQHVSPAAPVAPLLSLIRAEAGMLCDKGLWPYSRSTLIHMWLQFHLGVDLLLGKYTQTLSPVAQMQTEGKALHWCTWLSTE